MRCLCSRSRVGPGWSSSSTAGGAVRSWNSVADFWREVAVARIYDGVHYRYSTEVGTAMGKKVGALAARKIPRASDWGSGSAIDNFWDDDDGGAVAHFRAGG